jgi:bacterioferritin-associated ferredoxin
MYLCVCNRIPERVVKAMLKSGLTLKQIIAYTKLGDTCGTCLRYMREENM